MSPSGQDVSRGDLIPSLIFEHVVPADAVVSAGASPSRW
jgi:hypothetical protein